MGRGFLQPLFAVGYRADLTGKTNLAERDGLFRQRPVAQRRQHRQQHRQIGGGFLHADTADHVHEHVLIADHDPAVAMQHRQQHRQPVLLQAYRYAARIGQRRRIHQRLHFHQQRARAFAGHHHAAARLRRAAAGEENRRRIRHFAQALVAHREHAQLVDRAEAVLERAQHPEAAAAVAFEIQHRIDHVFEHARAGDAALFRDVTNEEDRGAGFLRVTDETRGAFAHLADRPRRRGQRFGPQRLHRIGDQQLRPHLRGLFEDALDAGFGQRAQAIQRQPQPRRAARHLRQRFLAGHVQRRQPAGHARQRLQQQCGFTDPRIAADQDHRAFDQTAAEHAVEFTDAGAGARVLVMQHILQRRDLGRIDLAGPTAAPRSRRCRRRRGFQHDLGERIPRPAFAALPLPFVGLGAAFAADEGGACFGGGFAHRNARAVRARTVAARGRRRRDARAFNAPRGPAASPCPTTPRSPPAG